MYKTCAINGKAVKRLYINGKLAHSSVPDAGALVNGEASADYGMGSPEKLGESSYTYDGQTYGYSVYRTFDISDVSVSFVTNGEGNLCPWFVSPHVVATAAHWGSALYTGKWWGGEREYDVSAWTNLSDWALENGWTEEQLRGMTDIGDVVVAKTTGVTTVQQASCPWFVKKETVDKYFWNGTLKGVVGFHAPQPTYTFDGKVYLPVSCYPIVWEGDGTGGTIDDESGVVI